MTGAHGALDVERTDVLPILLQERHQEVDGKTDVGGQFIGDHRHVADRDSEAKHLRLDESVGSSFINMFRGIARFDMPVRSEESQRRN